MMYSACGNQYEVSSKKLKIELAYDSAILPLGIYLKKMKTPTQIYIYIFPHDHHSIIYNSQIVEAT